MTAPSETAFERAALAADPTYAHGVEEIAARYDRIVRCARPDLLTHLRAEDPLAARTLQSSARSWCALLLAYLAGAGTFASFFSRASFDLAAISPVAMSLVAVSGVGYLLAALPIRRLAPPTPQVATAGWVLALLNGAALGFGGYLIASFAPEAAGWLVLGVAGVLLVLGTTIACAVARRGLSRAQRADTERRVAEFPGRLAAIVDDAYAGAERELREAWSALPDATRETIRAAFASAQASAPHAHATPIELGAPAGRTLVRERIAQAAFVIGVRSKR